MQSVSKERVTFGLAREQCAQLKTNTEACGATMGVSWVNILLLLHEHH
jgi:hypothetical protein